ncbi:MAG TPA: hypothetical protein VGG64_12270 [Pirellulales bacterium]|jgi:hypothetical protein
MPHVDLPTPRRWFQFTLGRLLATVTIVALIAAWIGWQVTLVGQRRALSKQIWECGGSVYSAADLAQSGRLPGIRPWLGDEPIGTIYLPPPRFSDEDFARVRAAFPEAHLFPSKPL